MWWFFQDMLPRWGRQPGLGIEGTTADSLQWVMEGRLACVDRASRGAPGILHCPWCPGPSHRTGGSYCHPYFCVKETWLDPVSIFPNRPASPDCLSYQPIHQSVQSLSHHILVQHLQWARILTTEAALVSTFMNMGFMDQGQVS